MQTIEQRLDVLEQQAKRAQARLDQLEAEREIAQLMGRYAVLFGAGQGRRIVEELWSRGEEVSLEYGASGVYNRPWQIMTYYIGKDIPGTLNTLSLSSPAIVLNSDGKRARGSWTAFGTETDPGDLGPEPVTEASNRRCLLSSHTEAGQAYRAEVLLQRYEVQFVKEAGAWRICHLHVMEYFRCPYNRDWVRYAKERFDTDGVWLERLFDSPFPLPEEAHGENLPGAPSTVHWQYTLDCEKSPVPDFI